MTTPLSPIRNGFMPDMMANVNDCVLEPLLDPGGRLLFISALARELTTEASKDDSHRVRRLSAVWLAAMPESRTLDELPVRASADSRSQRCFVGLGETPHHIVLRGVRLKHDP